MRQGEWNKIDIEDASEWYWVDSMDCSDTVMDVVVVCSLALSERQPYCHILGHVSTYFICTAVWLPAASQCF